MTNQLNLFDLHCDTPFELYLHGTKLAENRHHVSLAGAAVYPQYTQVMAIWSNRKQNDDTAFRNFHKIADYLMTELENNSHHITFVRDKKGFEAATTPARAFLAVEDARILGGRLDRLPVLYARGVRFLTLVWSGESCIGGAFDTSAGLTDFGKSVVEECFKMGIVPDISHASEATASETFAIAEAHKKPVIATHSCSHSVYAHPRNLRDEQFETIKSLGGLVGVSFCDIHLTDKQGATVDDVVRHVEHYMSLGGADIVAFGTDFDGADMPEGISCPADLLKVGEALARVNYTETQIRKLFSENATRFVNQNLI